jgi:hypothetical protein
MTKPSRNDLWNIIQTVALTVMAAGIAASGAVVGTLLSLDSGVLENELNIGLTQGALVFTLLLVPFAVWGDYQRPGRLIPMLVALVVLGVVFFAGMPTLVTEGNGVIVVCEEVMRDSGMWFPTTNTFGNKVGWLVLLLFPLLIVTLIVDLFLMVVSAPFILLTSAEVWAAGWKLVLLELGMVIGGGIGSFALGTMLRRRIS